MTIDCSAEKYSRFPMISHLFNSFLFARSFTPICSLDALPAYVRVQFTILFCSVTNICKWGLSVSPTFAHSPMPCELFTHVLPINQSVMYRRIAMLRNIWVASFSDLRKHPWLQLGYFEVVVREWKIVWRMIYLTRH